MPSSLRPGREGFLRLRRSGSVRGVARSTLVVALVDVLPWNNGWPEAEPRIRRLNELIRAVGEQERVIVLPSFSVPAPIEQDVAEGDGEIQLSPAKDAGEA